MVKKIETTLKYLVILFFIFLPIWLWPYVQIGFFSFILFWVLFLFVFKRPKDIWEELEKKKFFAIFVLLLSYWILNFLVVARIPFETLLKPSFWESDGKIFFAYLPLFLTLLQVNLKESQFKKMIRGMIFLSVLIALIGLIQLALNSEIPFLSNRQQFVLFGGIEKKFIGGHLSHNAAPAFYLFPLLYFLAKTFTDKKLSFRTLLSAGIIFLAIIFSLSRSGITGLIFGIIGMIGIFIWKNRKAINWKKTFLWAGILVSGISLSFFLVLQVSPLWAKKVNQVITLSGRNIRTRIRLWEKALDLSSQSALFGVGVSRFNDQNYTIRKTDWGLSYSEGGIIVSSDAHAHNFYLHLLAETGTLGLTIYLAFWFLTLRRLYQLYQKRRSTSFIYLATLASVIGLFATGFFENTLSSPSVMFFYCALIGLLTLESKEKKGERKLPRVLFTSEWSKRGGAQRVLLDYLRNTQALNREECYLVSFEEGELIDEARKLGYQAEVLSGVESYLVISRKKARLSKILKSLKAFLSAIWQIYFYVRDHEVDLIFSNAIKTHLVGGIAGKLAGKRVVARVHDILTSPEFNWKVRWVMVLIFKFLVDEILAVSEAAKESLVSLGVDPQKIEVIYNGIEINEKIAAMDLSQFGVEGDDKAIACIGRLTEWKGQHLAIQIWPEVLKEFPKAKLLIVGEAYFEREGYDQYLKRLVQGLGLERSVIFTGFVDNVYSLIKSVGLVLSTSVRPDPLPTIILESAALGTYIVAADTGGIPEMVNEKRIGLLYPSGDKEELLASIQRVFKNQKDGNRGFDHQFIKRFSMNIYVNKIDRVILNHFKKANNDE